MHRALLALAVLLVLPASTEAAPPWSAPRDVSGPFTFVDGLWAGGGLIGWRSGDGEAGAPVGRSGDPVFFGTGGGAVAIVRPVGSNRDPRSELRVAIRSGGRFGPSRRVAKHPRIAPPTLAGNARGDLAVAWFEDRSVVSDRVYVALRRAGHAFGKPIRLATGRIRGVSVAVGSRGDVLVAWNTVDKVRTRLKRRGHGFGRAETLRADPAWAAKLRPAVASSGRAYVAWASQGLFEGGDSGAAYYDVAVRPAGAARFRRAQRLDGLPAHRLGGPLDLALTGRGNAIAAWVSDRVRVAETGADGRFGPPRDLTAPGAVVDDDVTRLGGIDVAATPAGARLVTWTVPGPLVQAAFGPAGGPLGAPEDVATGETPRGAFPGPAIAFQLRGADGVHVQEVTRAG